MLIYALRQREKVNTKSKGATVAALAGSHCVACGGSLLAPVVTALSGGGAYISVARANTVLLIVLVINVIAIALIAHATISIAYKTAANDAREG